MIILTARLKLHDSEESSVMIVTFECPHFLTVYVRSRGLDECQPEGRVPQAPREQLELEIERSRVRKEMYKL